MNIYKVYDADEGEAKASPIKALTPEAAAKQYAEGVEHNAGTNFDGEDYEDLKDIVVIDSEGFRYDISVTIAQVFEFTAERRGPGGKWIDGKFHTKD